MAASSTSSTRMPGEEQDELWNIILLQSEVFHSRFREFHQQIELYIQQTGKHPLTGETAAAAHDTIPVRERTTPAATAPSPVVSDTILSLVRELCAPSGAVRDASAMSTLTKRVDGVATLTVEDKAQIIYILDASFRTTPATSSILLSAFEKDRGYGVLASWFETSCGLSDEANKSLSQLLLQFLAHHRPTLPFSRKTTLQKLRRAQSNAVGRKIRSQVKEMIEKYSEG